MKRLGCPSCGGSLDPDARTCPQCGSTIATRRCGVCFDLNLVDDRNCRRCGSRLPEEDLASRPEKIACPGCGAEMTPRRLAATAFDECDHCGGMWLCPVTVEEMASGAETRSQLKPFDTAADSAAAGPSRAQASVTYRRCPRCRKPMNRSNYALGSGVIVDVCKQHGTHFDRGELTRIFTFIEVGGLQKARRRQAEALREDLRDLRRKAIAIGSEAGEAPFSLEPSSQGPTALEILESIARRWLSGA